MMIFFNRTRLERVGVVGPELGLLWAGLKALDRSTPLQKQERGKGRQGLRPWPLRCLSQFLSERKDRLLRGRMCCVPFTDGVAWYS